MDKIKAIDSNIHKSLKRELHGLNQKQAHDFKQSDLEKLDFIKPKDREMKKDKHNFYQML